MGSFTGMIDPSSVVSIHPYFRVKPGKLAEAKAKLAGLKPEWFVFECGVAR